MTLPDPRRDAAALSKRNRKLVAILAGIAALLYLGIQYRWGWSR